MQEVARAFARTQFANHRYVMVLHTHQANPHVHLSVRAEGKDGQRLNPRKADLRRWREAFAEKLRELGIEAEASPQITRGGSRRTERLWHRKARDEGRVPGSREGEQAPVKLTRSRRDAALAWCEIAKVLASSEDVADRQLSRSIVNYARWLPGVRYKPPEQQAQRACQAWSTAAARRVDQPAPTWPRHRRSARPPSQIADVEWRARPTPNPSHEQGPSSPPDGLVGQGAEQPPAREPERGAPRAASRVRWRRAAPALDPARSATACQCFVVSCDCVQRARSDQRHATARGPRRTGAGNEPSAIQR